MWRSWRASTSSVRYSIFSLYWYNNTNTDAEYAASCADCSRSKCRRKALPPRTSVRRMRTTTIAASALREVVKKRKNTEK